MPTTIKMRCSRVAEFDAAGVNHRQVQLIATDRSGVPLNQDQVAYATLDGDFLDPFGAELEHDQLVDVVITVNTPAGTIQKK